jgi:type IV pilus assembly protein PilO
MSPAPSVKGMPLPVRLALVVIGLLVFAAGCYFVLVAPKKKDANKLAAQAVSLSEQISEARSSTATASSLAKIAAADHFRLTTAMPNAVDTPEVILELDAIAKASGIRFDSIVPGQVANQSAYQVLPITVVFQGSFYDLSDFLGRMQNLVLVVNNQLQAEGRLYTVDQITLDEGDEGFPTGIKATLALNAYIYGHPVALPVTSTTTTPTTGTEGGTAAAAAGGS